MSYETTTSLKVLVGVIAFFAVPMGLLMHVYWLERVHIFTGWRWPVRILSAMADRRSRVVGATPERLRKMAHPEHSAKSGALSEPKP